MHYKFITPQKPRNLRECKECWAIIAASFPERKLKEAQARFPNDVRYILQLHYVGKMTVGEIAALLGRSETLIRNKLHFGVYRLHRYFFPDPFKINPFSL